MAIYTLKMIRPLKVSHSKDYRHPVGQSVLLVNKPQLGAIEKLVIYA